MNLSLKFNCRLRNGSDVLFEIKNIANTETVLQRVKKKSSAKIKEVKVPTYYLLESMAESFKQGNYQNIPLNTLKVS